MNKVQLYTIAGITSGIYFIYTFTSGVVAGETTVSQILFITLVKCTIYATTVIGLSIFLQKGNGNMIPSLMLLFFLFLYYLFGHEYTPLPKAYFFLSTTFFLGIAVGCFLLTRNDDSMKILGRNILRLIVTISLGLLIVYAVTTPDLNKTRSTRTQSASDAPLFLQDNVDTPLTNNSDQGVKTVTMNQQESEALGSPSIVIISPQTGDSLKIGDKYDIIWDVSNMPQGGYIDIELFKISDDTIKLDKNPNSDIKHCANCIGGGLRSGVSAVSPIYAGRNTIPWIVGKRYDEEYVEPGSHYIFKISLNRTGTEAECPNGLSCVTPLAVGWSDGPFSLTN